VSHDHEGNDWLYDVVGAFGGQSPHDHLPVVLTRKNEDGNDEDGEYDVDSRRNVGMPSTRWE